VLFRKLATLRLDVAVFGSVEDLRWRGPHPNFEEVCRRMNSPNLGARVVAARAKSQQEQTPG
jgi:hypothetical protein